MYKIQYYKNLLILLFAITALLIALCSTCKAETVGKASWYSSASLKKEGSWKIWKGVMANGKVFDDKKYTCAMWGVPFGDRVRVTNVANGKSVIVTVTDRGPAKRLVKKGRIIDLSKGAFSKIADLKQGVIEVKIERI